MFEILTAEAATLIAAVLAAVFSLISTVVTVISDRNSARREAVRKILYDDVNKLGGELYHALAISKKMLFAPNDDKFDSLREDAIKRQKEIDILRSRVRYSLWGLDDGINQIKYIPFYIVHFRNDRDNPIPRNIIRIGTALRTSIDREIMRAVIEGKPPRLWRRILIAKRARKIRSEWLKGKPTT